MINFVFISPNFPETYYKFIVSLKKVGFNVLGIGDCPYDDLNPILKENLTEYYLVPSLADNLFMDMALEHFTNKYGHIDYLESNNEYWLEKDARLRERFNISTGFYPQDMDKIKYKSKMKEYFKKAGVKVARYILCSTFKKSKEFIEEVGYPVFVKPDNGVGAANSHSIKNDEELIKFHENDVSSYIMEEYLEGSIVSFDGMANWDSEPLIMFNETFPTPVADVVNEELDDYYYANTDMPLEFREMGKRVVKAFGIRKRCFHIEFFKLSKARPGLAKEGEIIALEVNMRPPGGYTPDLLSLALNSSFYDCYASLMQWNEIREDLNKEKFISIAISRRDSHEYVHNEEDIKNKYGLIISEIGKYPKSISDAMGDWYIFLKDKNLDILLDAKDYILKRK